MGEIIPKLFKNNFETVKFATHFFFCFQAFINTAKEIYQKIQEGVFDINNEVMCQHSLFDIFFIIIWYLI